MEKDEKEKFVELYKILGIIKPKPEECTKACMSNFGKPCNCKDKPKVSMGVRG